MGQSGKPLLIYVESKLSEDEIESAVVKQTVERDEKVAIGAKMFHLIRIDGAAIDRYHPHWNTLGGKKLPRMVVVDSAGDRVGSVEGTISPSSVFTLMKKASAKSFKMPLDSFVKEYQKILTDVDRVEGLKQALAQRRAASTEAKSASKERFYAEEEAKIAAMEKEVLDREAALLNHLPRKGDVAKAGGA